MAFRWITIVLATTTITVPVLGQDAGAGPSSADYARARALQNPMALVRDAAVVHHWIGRKDEFWYRQLVLPDTPHMAGRYAA